MRKSHKSVYFFITGVYLNNFNKEQAGAELCQAQFELRLAKQKDSFADIQAPGLLRI